MEMDYLREYIVLGKLLNFSKTADFLYVSQPSLSRHIASLEDEVGVCLLHRTTHAVQLTQSGKDFLKTAINIVDQYDQSIEKLKAANNGLEKTLGVGILYYQKELILDKIENLKKIDPNIKLHYLAGTPNEILNAIFKEQIDIGATMHVGFDNYELLEFYDLHTEKLVLMVSNDHPLANRGHISIAELKNELFVCVDDNFYKGYLSYIIDLWKPYGFEPRLIKLVEDYETMLLTIQLGPGFAIITTNMKEKGNLNCTFLDIDNEDFMITRSLTYKSDNTNPLIPLFIDLFHTGIGYQ